MRNVRRTVSGKGGKRRGNGCYIHLTTQQRYKVRGSAPGVARANIKFLLEKSQLPTKDSKEERAFEGVQRALERSLRLCGVADRERARRACVEDEHGKKSQRSARALMAHNISVSLFPLQFQFIPGYSQRIWDACSQFLASISKEKNVDELSGKKQEIKKTDDMHGCETNASRCSHCNSMSHETRTRKEGAGAGGSGLSPSSHLVVAMGSIRIIKERYFVG